MLSIQLLFFEVKKKIHYHYLGLPSVCNKSFSNHEKDIVHSKSFLKSIETKVIFA